MITKAAAFLAIHAIGVAAQNDTASIGVASHNDTYIAGAAEDVDDVLVVNRLSRG